MWISKAWLYDRTLGEIQAHKPKLVCSLLHRCSMAYMLMYVVVVLKYVSLYLWAHLLQWLFIFPSVFRQFIWWQRLKLAHNLQMHEYMWLDILHAQIFAVLMELDPVSLMCHDKIISLIAPGTTFEVDILLHEQQLSTCRTIFQSRGLI